MTASTKDTFTIYNEQFITGYTETLVMETNIFNAASRGAITLQKSNKLGDYAKETIFDLVSSITGRRDISSLAAADDKDLTTSEIVDVKLNRKHGPVKKTLDALKKIGKDPAEFSFILGQQVAKAVLVDQVNVALAAVGGSLWRRWNHSRRKRRNDDSHGACLWIRENGRSSDSDRSLGHAFRPEGRSRRLGNLRKDHERRRWDD